MTTTKERFDQVVRELESNGLDDELLRKFDYWRPMVEVGLDDYEEAAVDALIKAGAYTNISALMAGLKEQAMAEYEKEFEIIEEAKRVKNEAYRQDSGEEN